MMMRKKTNNGVLSEHQEVYQLIHSAPFVQSERSDSVIVEHVSIRCKIAVDAGFTELRNIIS